MFLDQPGRAWGPGATGVGGVGGVSADCQNKHTREQAQTGCHRRHIQTRRGPRDVYGDHAAPLARLDEVTSHRAPRGRTLPPSHVAGPSQ